MSIKDPLMYFGKSHTVLNRNLMFTQNSQLKQFSKVII
jgi:hypothetical protein